MEQSTLNVTELRQEPKEAIDGREYAVIGVKAPVIGGLINTTKPRSRVIWSHQPMSGPGADVERKNDYYEPILNALNAGKTPTITGEIVTAETEPYFIENPNGEHSHPKTGNSAHRVTQKTYVVFPDENVETLLRNDGLKPKGASEESAEATQGFTASDEELVSEDLGAEAPVS